MPSAPLPFFAAVHATHVPPQAVLQQAPSEQWPLEQSASSEHNLPEPQGFAHDPPPPQYTSVSAPFLEPGWSRVTTRDNEEVRRLDIAMNDPDGMRLGERLARFTYIRCRLLRREHTTLVEHRFEIRALEVLHDDERRPCLEPAHVEHRGDVTTPQLRDGARLAEEALHALHVAKHRRQHELDGADLVEIDVRGRDDDPHRADAEHALDAVLPGEDLADPYRGDADAPPVGLAVGPPEIVTGRPSEARCSRRSRIHRCSRTLAPDP